MSEWISVNDRLPEFQQVVLYVFNGYRWLGKYHGKDEDGLPVFGGRAGFISGDATHWMPAY